MVSQLLRHFGCRPHPADTECQTRCNFQQTLMEVYRQQRLALESLGCIERHSDTKPPYISYTHVSWCYNVVMVHYTPFPFDSCWIEGLGIWFPFCIANRAVQFPALRRGSRLKKPPSHDRSYQLLTKQHELWQKSVAVMLKEVGYQAILIVPTKIIDQHGSVKSQNAKRHLCQAGHSELSANGASPPSPLFLAACGSIQAEPLQFHGRKWPKHTNIKAMHNTAVFERWVCEWKLAKHVQRKQHEPLATGGKSAGAQPPITLISRWRLRDDPKQVCRVLYPNIS